MSLNSAFQIGRSALSASQLGLQTAGNNVANAATPGYSRQIISFSPAQDGNAGRLFVGRGVDVGAIRRQVDTALQARLQSSISQQSASENNLKLLSTVESSLGALSDNDLNTQLSSFFNSWSELANAPTDPARRALTVQKGRTVSTFLQETRAGLVDQKTQIDRDLTATVGRANDVLNQIAGLNAQVVLSDNGSGNANALRDQRDQLVTELSQYVDVSSVEQANGTLDLFVGSTPIVLAGRSRGLQLTTTPGSSTSGPTSTLSVTTTDNNEVLDVRSGQIGSLLSNRTTLVDNTLSRLDTLAAQLIFQVNRAHSVGYGANPLTTSTGSLQVGAADVNLAFNDPTNQTFARLPYQPTNGSFLVTMTNQATGASQSVRINIDLDGLTNTGAQGFTNDTSLGSLVTSLNGVPNLTATTNASGQLVVNAASGFKINFSDDSSGVLATLGINSYFSGTGAGDIAVRQELIQTPGLLATGRLIGGQRSDNDAARAISTLQDAGVAGLGGSSISGYWDETTSDIATRTGSAKISSDSAKVVRDSLDAQRAAVSGVNVDEEAINLITYQRQYQASARFISTVDEMTQTLLAIAR